MGDNGNDRKKIQGETTKLYQLRGKVVHGNTHLNDADASVSAVAGLQIAINALRKIYTERPQLVQMDGVGRSLAMILQIDS